MHKELLNPEHLLPKKEVKLSPHHLPLRLAAYLPLQCRADTELLLPTHTHSLAFISTFRLQHNSKKNSSQHKQTQQHNNKHKQLHFQVWGSPEIQN